MNITPTRTYIASSWQYPLHDDVVDALFNHGFEVYDYRKPPDRPAMDESDLLGPDSLDISLSTTLSNFMAIGESSFVVACLPGGASTHVEIGYALALGIPVFAFCSAAIRPDAFHATLRPLSGPARFYGVRDDVAVELARDLIKDPTFFDPIDRLFPPSPLEPANQEA